MVSLLSHRLAKKRITRNCLQKWKTSHRLDRSRPSSRRTVEADCWPHVFDLSTVQQTKQPPTSGRESLMSTIKGVGQRYTPVGAQRSASGTGMGSVSTAYSKTSNTLRMQLSERWKRMMTTRFRVRFGITTKICT